MIKHKLILHLSIIDPLLQHLPLNRMIWWVLITWILLYLIWYLYLLLSCKNNWRITIVLLYLNLMTIISLILKGMMIHLKTLVKLWNLILWTDLIGWYLTNNLSILSQLVIKLRLDLRINDQIRLIKVWFVNINGLLNLGEFYLIPFLLILIVGLKLILHFDQYQL